RRGGHRRNGADACRAAQHGGRRARRRRRAAERPGRRRTEPGGVPVISAPRSSVKERRFDGPSSGRGRWTVLAVVMIGFFMILLDGTIMNVAVPPLQQDLSATYSQAQWMMSGYALGYGLLLIPAGRLGDRFGHRRLFIVGLAGFTFAS